MKLQLPKRAVRDKTIVQLFKDGKTMEEVGSEFNLTRERVRQILEERGVTSDQGGITVRIKKREESIVYCDVQGCSRKAKESSTLCHWHKKQIDDYGRFDCLVEGCGQTPIKYGMCNNHGTNYFIHKQRGTVKDTHDYLQVQLAKQLMGAHTVPLTKIREFMKDNPELLEVTP